MSNDEISRLTPEELQKFYKPNYMAENAEKLFKGFLDFHSHERAIQNAEGQQRLQEAQTMVINKYLSGKHGAESILGEEHVGMPKARHVGGSSSLERRQNAFELAHQLANTVYRLRHGSDKSLSEEELEKFMKNELGLPLDRLVESLMVSDDVREAEMMRQFTYVSDRYVNKPDEEHYNALMNENTLAQVADDQFKQYVSSLKTKDGKTVKDGATHAQRLAFMEKYHQSAKLDSKYSQKNAHLFND